MSTFFQKRGSQSDAARLSPKLMEREVEPNFFADVAARICDARDCILSSASGRSDLSAIDLIVVLLRAMTGISPFALWFVWFPDSDAKAKEKRLPPVPLLGLRGKRPCVKHVKEGALARAFLLRVVTQNLSTDSSRRRLAVSKRLGCGQRVLGGVTPR